MKSKFNLFKQPYKVGDTMTVDNIPFVIIGIQRFHYNAIEKCLYVEYFIQNLSIPYSAKKVSISSPGLYKGWFLYTLQELDKWKFEREAKPLQLNDLVYFDRLEATAKVVEIINLEFIGTDLKAWVMVQPMYPIDPTKAKDLYKKERLKGFELVDY